MFSWGCEKKFSFAVIVFYLVVSKRVESGLYRIENIFVLIYRKFRVWLELRFTFWGLRLSRVTLCRFFGIFIRFGFLLECLF